MKTKTLLVTGFIVALVIAGVVSFYASSQPDGLEYVAGETGFLDTAEDSATADSPFADYATTGVENDRLSLGVAGVVGTLLVGSLGGGLFWLVRKRDRSDELVS